MRNIKYIVVHTTYTSQNATLAQLKRGWKALGWKNNGYHYIIYSNGTIENITPENQIANGVGGFNRNSIHVAYIGGKVNNRPKDNRTELQKAALIVLLTELKVKYPKAVIKGHRDFSPDTNKNGKIDTWEFIKECPCFNAIEEYKNI